MDTQTHTIPLGPAAWHVSFFSQRQRHACMPGPHVRVDAWEWKEDARVLRVPYRDGVEWITPNADATDTGCVNESSTIYE